MTKFYIISSDDYDKVSQEHGQDWPCSKYQNVSPVKIYSGAYAGSYAVNIAFLDGESSKEKYRAILEACDVRELNPLDLQPTEE